MRLHVSPARYLRKAIKVSRQKEETGSFVHGSGTIALVSVDSVINAISSKRLHSCVMMEIRLQSDARAHITRSINRRSAERCTFVRVKAKNVFCPSY